MHVTQRKEALAARFVEVFRCAPAVWCRAPGRVDLMGSHTDYNLGYVMTMTVERDTWIAAAPRADRCIAVYSMNVTGGGTFSLDAIEPAADAPWTNYIRGMAQVLQQVGYPLRGMNALVHSTVPFGSGLSSSAALEMAAGCAFQQIGGFHIDPVTLARLGQQAENQFVGVNCGILDQYSSAKGAAGCALLLDCQDLTSRAVPIAADIQVLICDTRAERNLAGTEYGERRSQCEAGARLLAQFDPSIHSLREVSLAFFAAHRPVLPEVVAKRCQFIIEENQRVLDLAGALASGNRAQLNMLFAASYAGARDLYEISAPSMQMMMDAIFAAPGIIGARQAGAGFGGCLVALVEQAQVGAFIQQVSTTYLQAAGIPPQVYPVQASAGAGLLVDA